MTPHELTARLRALQARTESFGPAMETAAQKVVYSGIPPTVGVSMVRTHGGVSIVLEGRGASAHAKRIRPLLRDAARGAVR
jgi:hypothetical protein